MPPKQNCYVCSNCGIVSPKWAGKCEGCQAWNSLEINTSIRKNSKKNLSPNDLFISLNDVDEKFQTRLTSGIAEFDRVTGGGLVPGSVILLGGNPGIGKSTLMLQIVSHLSNNYMCIYASGEEGLAQIKVRGKRLNVNQEKFSLSTCTDILQLTRGFEQTKDLDVVIIDSIQTMTHPDIEAASGTVSQIRAVCQVLIDSAKRYNYTVIMIGHVTKEGVFAGPKLLEHMVDTVLYFDGDNSLDFRVLRTVKNRFGPTNEIGVFEMNEEGLKEVTNPSSLFLSSDQTLVSGTAITASIEGTRPILCEVQTLISQSYLPSPRRVSIGYDNNRLSMLTAVLSTRCKLPLGDKDIYLNIAGGLTLKDPATDLAVSAALISSLKNEAVSQKNVYCGEIALSGQIRPVRMIDQRLKESAKLGFENIICKGNKIKSKEISVCNIDHVRELVG